MLISYRSPATWERSLLNLAHEAFYEVKNRPQHAQTGDQPASAAELRNAYQHCRRLTAFHSRSFYLASQLLPSAKRRAMHALYAFCRTADDLIDHPGPDPLGALADWRRRSGMPAYMQQDPAALAWADTRERYRIPARLAEQLLNGVARDTEPALYQTFDDLAEYAYGVASTVGLMSMHITGFSGRQAIPYAIKLGVALQLTNILRDVSEDLRSGRVYLPAEELKQFGITLDDLAEGKVSYRWRKFMRFQIQRNRRLYAESWPGIAMLNPDGRLAIAAAADFYAAILDDIERHDYDVFSRRAHLSPWKKIRRLPGIYKKVRIIQSVSVPRAAGRAVSYKDQLT